MSRQVKLAFILTLGVLAMSSASILIRLAFGQGVPPLVVAAVRLGVAAAALTVPALTRRRSQEYVKLGHRQLGVLILSGILLGLHFATWVTSLAHTSVISSVVLVTTTPLWLGLASPLLLKEPTPRVVWLGIACAIVGGVIIGTAGPAGEGQATAWGNFLALSGAVLAAGYLLIGRSIREAISLLPYLWVVYGVGTLVLLVMVAIKGQTLVGYSPLAYAYMSRSSASRSSASRSVPRCWRWRSSVRCPNRRRSPGAR